MYIKQLTIKNFRNFGDPPLVITLKPFTLILGENNIGKTNLLSALGLIFSQEILHKLLRKEQHISSGAQGQLNLPFPE